MDQTSIVDSSSDLTEVGRIDILSRREELCMVENIEEFRSELQISPFPEGEVLNSREIRIHKVRAIEGRTACIPQFPWGGINKAARVKELVKAMTADAAATNLVWTVDVITVVREIDPGLVVAGNDKERKARSDLLNHVNFPIS